MYNHNYDTSEQSFKCELKYEVMKYEYMGRCNTNREQATLKYIQIMSKQNESSIFTNTQTIDMQRVETLPPSDLWVKFSSHWENQSPL